MTAGWSASLPEDGEAARLVRETDWAATPLGPVDGWPPALRTAVGIVLRSRFPLMVAWGPELVQVYNDAFLPIVGEKHPQVGARIADSWSEVWDVVGPRLRAVLETGEPIWSQDELLLIDRLGFPEDTHFTYCYSAVPDESGRPGGIWCTAMETTERVLDARRLRVLNGLVQVSQGAESVAELVTAVAEHLAEHPEDVRGAALYLDTGVGLRLAAATRHGGTRPPVDPADDAGAFRLPSALPQTCTVVPATAPLPPPPGLPEQLQVPATQVALVGFRGSDGAADGVLAVALSPHRRLDEAYLAFLTSLGQQVGTAVAAVAARETQRRRLDELARLDRAKREFLADVSHELRTPLTLVNGPLDDLVADPSLPASVRSRLAVARRASSRLTRLVDDLLTYSRAEAGALTSTPVPVDLAERARTLAALFEGAAERAGLRLRVEAEPLPAPVLVDPAHLETALVNLLSNAVKFTRRGEVVVRTRATPEGGCVEVADTGIGIDEQDQERVFERFARTRSEGSPTVEGTGIGLSLVRSVLALDGGTVGVRSRPGEGSTFTVLLPWSDAAAAPQAVPAAGSRSAAWEARRAAPAVPGQERDRPAALSAVLPRVLLADDNDDLREWVSGLLEPYAVVLGAADGSRAMDLLETEPVDLLLTDVMMPGVDGLSLLDRVRADPRLRHLPVVVFSARAGEQAAVEALERGADDYLVKPFPAIELVARVRASIERNRARRQDALLRGRRGAGSPQLPR